MLGSSIIQETQEDIQLTEVEQNTHLHLPQETIDAASFSYSSSFTLSEAQTNDAKPSVNPTTSPPLVQANRPRKRSTCQAAKKV